MVKTKCKILSGKAGISVLYKIYLKKEYKLLDHFFQEE